MVDRFYVYVEDAVEFGFGDVEGGLYTSNQTPIPETKVREGGGLTRFLYAHPALLTRISSTPHFFSTYNPLAPINQTPKAKPQAEPQGELTSVTTLLQSSARVTSRAATRVAPTPSPLSSLSILAAVSCAAFSFISETKTLAPSCTKRVAMARPKPDPAPTTWSSLGFCVDGGGVGMDGE